MQNVLKYNPKLFESGIDIDGEIRDIMQNDDDQNVSYDKASERFK